VIKKNKIVIIDFVYCLLKKICFVGYANDFIRSCNEIMEIYSKVINKFD
jgi:hypothetical protein